MRKALNWWLDRPFWSPRKALLTRLLLLRHTTSNWWLWGSFLGHRPTTKVVAGLSTSQTSRVKERRRRSPEPAHAHTVLPLAAMPSAARAIATAAGSDGIGLFSDPRSSGDVALLVQTAELLVAVMAQ